MSERPPTEQLAILTEAEILEIQDLDELADIRRHLFATAMANLALCNEITKVFRSEGLEKGARLRKITGPDQIDMEARDE